ncbi:uncharacterized protein LOC114525659 [Dendronephthya gigantea]|uniref:uncharacterized protein LOC114525659 n=1 Tax=Dendronephthya gigantea TaxID=151771 RepID=UPI00106C5220|nr:uncharacterized protein LOC114525659 [Dendronephthya gigantea]
MSSDGEHFNFDANANHYAPQEDRHSPPALDESHETVRRPPLLTIPRQGSVDFTRYEDILKQTKRYNTISDIPYHIISEVHDLLNIKKENRMDWRNVASRMGVKPTIIEKFEKEIGNQEDENHKGPSQRLFKEISDQKITKLLQVLYQMNRHDVLNVFHDDMCEQSSTALERRENFKKYKNPSQETTPVSGSSTSEFMPSPCTPKSPYKDAGTPSSAERPDSGVGSLRSPPFEKREKSGSFAKQHTDDNLAPRVQSSISFHTSESDHFWRSIPPIPKATTKEWRKFEELLKKEFKEESQKSQIMRFICYVLKIEPYEERHNKYVHDRDFANLVAWFGPIKTGNDGLFYKIADLMKKSTTYKTNTGPHSFFAGYMTKEDADQLIGNAEKVGTYLIRFSSTYADTGSFVVCLKSDTGPEHVLLQGNPETGKISYDGKDYDDLVQLWRRGLCMGKVSQDRKTSCTTICPNLPLNAMFKPYGAGPSQSQPAGRGRGRGRGQER